MQSLKPKPYFSIKIQTQTCSSSLHLHIHTDCTSVFQPIKQTKKENLNNSENLCSCSAIVKTENLCSSSATTGDLEAIPSLLFNNRQFRRQAFFSLFGFLFNYRFQGFQRYMGLLEGRHFFPHSISVSKIMFEIMQLYHMAD